MTRRAARGGDQHTCPSKDPKPHLGGPVQRGFAKVLIEGKPAARAGDMATCQGATDVVSEGSGTVKIGKMHAARRGDACVHGGSVTGGAATVFIGGPTVSPPEVAAIAKNAAEIDRLRRRQEERREKLKQVDDYLKKRQEEDEYEDGKAAGRKAGEKIAKKVLGDIVKRIVEKGIGKGGDLPPGGDDFTEQKAKTRAAADDLKKDLEKGIKRDEDRIEELEKENEGHAAGEHPKPRPPDPELDKPIKGKPPINKIFDED